MHFYEPHVPEVDYRKLELKKLKMTTKAVNIKTYQRKKKAPEECLDKTVLKKNHKELRQKLEARNGLFAAKTKYEEYALQPHLQKRLQQTQQLISQTRRKQQKLLHARQQLLKRQE